MKVDGQVVWKDGKKQSHSVDMFVGSVHSLESFIEFGKVGAHKGDFRVRTIYNNIKRHVFEAYATRLRMRSS